MQGNQASFSPDAPAFAATRWSLVASAGDRAQASLAELCVRLKSCNKAE